MPKIASHHLPDAPLGAKDPYTPSNEWEDDTTVQWGARGVVLGKNSYSTAFFEAFPAKAGFIRGEGKTIAEAEEDALKKWRRESVCDHIWGRAHYTNGAALCKKCKAFGSKQFHPILKLGSWRDPVDEMDIDSIVSGWLRGSERRSIDEARKHIRQRWLRARASGVRLPPVPEARMTTAEFMQDVRDPYREACREAVADWIEREECPFDAKAIARILRRIEESRESDIRISLRKTGSEWATS